MALLMVSSRILAPEDFGYAAFVSAIIAIVEVISKGGLSQSLIQKQILDEGCYLSVLKFYFGISVVVISLSLTFCIGSYFFYSSRFDLYLGFFIAVLGLPLVLFSGVLVARLSTSGNLSIVAGTELRASLISGLLIGIPLLYFFESWYALVLVKVFCDLCVFSMLSRTVRFVYFDIFGANLHSLVGIVYFGAKLTLARIINVISLRVQDILIPSYLNIHSLGLYNRASAIANVPVDVFGQIFEKVLFPMSSKKVAEGKAVVENVIPPMVLTSIGVICFASMMFVEPIVLLVLGEKWRLITEVVDLLLGFVFFRMSYRYFDSLIKASGKAGLMIFLNLIQLAAVVVLFFVLKSEGLEGVVLALGFSYVVRFLCSMTFFWGVSSRNVMLGICLVGVSLVYLLGLLFYHYEKFQELV